MLHLISAVWHERQRQHYSQHWLLQLKKVAGLTSLSAVCRPPRGGEAHSAVKGYNGLVKSREYTLLNSQFTIVNCE